MSAKILAVAAISFLMGAYIAWSASKPDTFTPSPVPSDTVLTVVGDVDTCRSFTGADFARLPHTTVRATGHDSKVSDFAGVALGELLRRAGVRLGKQMRGPRIAVCVVAEAPDGYRAVFALPEADTSFATRTILVSDRRDGAPTLAWMGPLQVVVPGEKEYARWVRQVRTLRVRRL